MKTIAILATGGTIAGKSNSQTSGEYDAGGLSVDELLASNPELEKLANLKAFQVANIGSQDLDDDVMIALAKKANELLLSDEIDGAVVIHGTDTMEESAYFLNLVVNSKKPIVFTGAMRSASSISSDGGLNLYNAISVAASKKSRKMGVLVVLNDEIHAARELTKGKTTFLNAFSSPNSGKIGSVHYGEVEFYLKSLKLNTYKSEFNISQIEKLPRVDIIYAHQNDTDIFVKACVDAKSKAIIHAGFGNGNIFHKTLKELKKARDLGIVIARNSRVGQGKVSQNGEISNDKLGFISCNDLNSQKARILLRVALTKSKDLSQLQAILNAY